METRELRLQAFGRSCHITVDDLDGHGDESLALCRAELERLEDKFSAYKTDSLISQLNRTAGTGAFIPLDAEARSLFTYVDALWSESKHLFDPTTRILSDCYDAKGRLRASPEQLKGMLKLVGWKELEITEQGAHLAKKGMLVDLNNCIRPYAIDALRKLLLKQGAQHALLEMDHDIATIGKQPDGANWLIGVRFPRGPRPAIARLKLNDKGYAMRGDYEHTVQIDGERFGKALSPIDGQAIPGLLSVAVIAENCVTACSAATVARMKTEASAIKWLDKLGLQWMAIDRQYRCHGPLAPI